jgi:sarcosine oxidase gamma subunit
MVAEWMTHGVPEIDPHQSDITRFYPYARNDHHVRARCAEHFNKTYGIVHPREQWESERNLRCAPYHTRTEALGAVYFQAGGWERPHWYTSNAGLVDEYGVEDRPAEWDARWWSPISSAEHLAMRDRVGMVDLAPFVVFEITGPGALDYLQSLTVNNCNVAVGRSVYTPLLDQHGGFRSDLTIMRLGETSFRVVTGAFDGPRDEHWFRTHLPADGSVSFVDRTSALCTIGVWGPRARDLMSSVTDADVSDGAFPYGTTQEVLFGSLPVRLFRISYVGDLGWRSTSRWRTGSRSGTRCGPPGRTMVWSPSVPGCTAPAAGWRRATGSWARSSAASTTRWRPAWPAPRSSRPTSSARRPTWPPVRRSRPPCCARSRSRTTSRPVTVCVAT